MVKICKIHGKEYAYTCPECVKPFLKLTKFSSFEDVRKYQEKKALKVSLINKNTDYNLIGIIKIRFSNDTAYLGVLFYNLKEKKVIDLKFKAIKPIFSEYFSSILFLNQTDLYLNLIKDIEIIPDCYILNASGQIHPYYYGSACDLGLNIDVPVIGYTKKLLFGEIITNSTNPRIPRIYHGTRLIGFAIPRPNSKKFLYISVGNNISLQSARKIFLNINLNLFNTISVKLNVFIKSCLRV
ncbi:MAG: endonuclease V [Promethearchaeota archaeon]